MNKLKISTKLALLIGILGALLMLIGGIGLYGISKSDAALDSLYAERTVPISQLGEMQYLQLRNRLAIANALIEQAPDRTANTLAEVEANMGQISKVWEVFKATPMTPRSQKSSGRRLVWEVFMATPMTPEEAQIAKVYAEKRQQYVQEGLLPALAALRTNDFKEVQRVLIEKIHPTFDAVREQATALMKLQMEQAKKEFDAAVARFHTLRWLAMASIVLGLLFAVFFGLTLSRGVTVPLRRAVAAGR